MTHSDSVAAIGAALAKAQGVIEGATKDSTNPHFNNKYADLASVVGACRDALSANGIAFLQSPANDGNLVRMRTRLVHASGEWIESDDLTVQARDAGPQAVGSCLTYLRRYQLAAMVGVAPENDDDAEAGEGRTVPVVTAPRVPVVAPRVPVAPAKAESHAEKIDRIKREAKAVQSEGVKPAPMTSGEIPFGGRHD